MDEMAEELLRMPPQPPQREERGQFISKDEQLEDFDECNYVFTDITVGHSDEVCVLLESFIFCMDQSFLMYIILLLNAFRRHDMWLSGRQMELSGMLD